MKTLCITLIALFIAVSFTACKKEADVDPDLANRVAGNYTLTRISLNDVLYTVNASTSGTMNVVRESATSVQLSLDIKSTTAQSVAGTFNAVTLTDVGNGEVTLSKDGVKLGTGGNNTLSIQGTDKTGTRFVFIGTK